MIRTPSPAPTDYFLGVPWDGDALAAVLAGSIALVTLAWSVSFGIVSFIKTRNRLSRFETESLKVQREAVEASVLAAESQEAVALRDHQRTMVDDAITYALSGTDPGRAYGIDLLEEFIDAPWPSDEDFIRIGVALNTVGR